MPLRAMMGLFARSAWALEDQTWGVALGKRMTDKGYGLWLVDSVRAATLGEARGSAVTTGWALQIGSRLELASEGEPSILRLATSVRYMRKI